MAVPQSLMPRSRLMADITSPPPKPGSVIARHIPADCQGVNGVAHHRAEPIRTVAETPPIRPSHVLLGLTVGATFRRPSVLPNTYCKTSLSSQMKMKYSSSLAF